MPQETEYVQGISWHYTRLTHDRFGREIVDGPWVAYPMGVGVEPYDGIEIERAAKIWEKIKAGKFPSPPFKPERKEDGKNLGIFARIDDAPRD